DLRALRGEHPRRDAAHAAGAAGDDRDLVLQAAHATPPSDADPLMLGRWSGRGEAAPPHTYPPVRCLVLAAAPPRSSGSDAICASTIRRRSPTRSSGSIACSRCSWSIPLSFPRDALAR